MGSNYPIGRRKVLKITGSSLSALAITTSQVSAVEQHSPPVNPGKPKFGGNNQYGWSKGTFNNPITPETTNKIHKKLLKSPPSNIARSGVAFPDIEAEQNKYKNDSKSNDKVLLGYFAGWHKGYPRTISLYAPKFEKLTSGRITNIGDIKTHEKSAKHRKIDKVVENWGGE